MISVLVNLEAPDKLMPFESSPMAFIVAKPTIGETHAYVLRASVHLWPMRALWLLRRLEEGPQLWFKHRSGL